MDEKKLRLAFEGLASIGALEGSVEERLAEALEKVSAQTSTLYGQNESETIEGGLEAGRRAGFWGDPVKKRDQSDGSVEADL